MSKGNESESVGSTPRETLLALITITKNQGTPTLGIYPPHDSYEVIDSNSEFDLKKLEDKYEGRHKGFGTTRLTELARKNSTLKLFNDFRIRAQTLMDPTLSHLVSALNALSSQPSLVFNLIAPNSTIQSKHKVKVNVCGVWKEVEVSDNVILYQDRKGVNYFICCSPFHGSNEIWHILLEKAYAQVYRGYENLIGGYESHILRDFTGAPVITQKINQISLGSTIDESNSHLVSDLFNRISKRLAKGYILTLIPRTPTKTELELNKINANNLSRLGYGIYSGHSYSVLNATRLKSQNGDLEMMIKLRNPFYGERWEGPWNYASDNWDQANTTRPDFQKAVDGDNQFWIPVSVAMMHFSHMNICKVNPCYVYRSLVIGIKQYNFVTGLVRITVEKPGKYTLTISQSDAAFYNPYPYEYSQIELSLGVATNESVRILAFTHTKTMKNTSISKFLKEGEYFLLFERKVPRVNLSSEEQHSTEMEGWRDLTFSSYGPAGCPCKLVECSNYSGLHEYIMAEGWRNFNDERRIGLELVSFDVPFTDKSTHKVKIEKLSIPEKQVFSIANPNSFSMILHIQFAETSDFMYIGPRGKFGDSHSFAIPANGASTFIIRVLKGESKDVTFNIIGLIGEKVSTTFVTPNEIMQLNQYITTGLKPSPETKTRPKHFVGSYTRNGERLLEKNQDFEGIREKEQIVRKDAQVNDREIRFVKGNTEKRTKEEHDQIVKARKDEMLLNTRLKRPSFTSTPSKPTVTRNCQSPSSTKAHHIIQTPSPPPTNVQVTKLFKGDGTLKQERRSLSSSSSSYRPISDSHKKASREGESKINTSAFQGHFFNPEIDEHRRNVQGTRQGRLKTVEPPKTVSKKEAVSWISRKKLNDNGESSANKKFGKILPSSTTPTKHADNLILTDSMILVEVPEIETPAEHKINTSLRLDNFQQCMTSENQQMINVSHTKHHTLTDEITQKIDDLLLDIARNKQMFHGDGNKGRVISSIVKDEIIPVKKLNEIEKKPPKPRKKIPQAANSIYTKMTSDVSQRIDSLLKAEADKVKSQQSSAIKASCNGSRRLENASKCSSTSSRRSRFRFILKPDLLSRRRNDESESKARKVEVRHPKLVKDAPKNRSYGILPTHKPRFVTPQRSKRENTRSYITKNTSNPMPMFEVLEDRRVQDNSNGHSQRSINQLSQPQLSEISNNFFVIPDSVNEDVSKKSRRSFFKTVTIDRNRGDSPRSQFSQESNGNNHFAQVVEKRPIFEVIEDSDNIQFQTFDHYKHSSSQRQLMHRDKSEDNLSNCSIQNRFTIEETVVGGTRFRSGRSRSPGLPHGLQSGPLLARRSYLSSQTRMGSYMESQTPSSSRPLPQLFFTRPFKQFLPNFSTTLAKLNRAGRD